MRERARRRRQESLAADPTLAQDLLGSSDPGVSTDVVDPGQQPDAQDEELGRLLATHAPRARVPWVSAGLVGAILLAAGYVAGGYHYSHQGRGTATAARAGGGFTGFGQNAARTGRTPTAQASASSATGQGGFGGGFGGGAGAGATIGTVKLVDGDKVYLTSTSGDTVKVTLAKGATVTVSKHGTLSDLAPGSTVVVIGKTGGDGTVTATSVSQGGGSGARQGTPSG